jgi:uncharacterized protein YbcV (DUF1398 family)
MTIDPETTASLHKIWDKVHTPKNNSQPTFPETVRAVSDLGVSRYRVDFITSSTNAYVGNQADEYTYADHVSDLNPGTIEWAPEKLKAAIQEAQVLADKGKGDYTEFCRKAIMAGVVEYAVFIDGKKVVYFGPLGESYTESLSGHKPKAAASATSSCCVM